MPWRRTPQSKGFDFIFADADGVDVGRIYRHPDKNRWQWFGWVDGAPSGICDTKDEAVKAIEELAKGGP